MRTQRICLRNGGTYRTGPHCKGTRKCGLTEEKLARVPCWRESPGFIGKERTAIDWAEAVTNLSGGHVSDAHSAASQKRN